MISFQDNIDEFERSLTDFAARQLPFAVAQALNDTAEDVDKVWQEEIERQLDRPTPFSKRGTRRIRATKRRQVATVTLKTIQAEYLKIQVRGGVRRPARRAILVPVGQRKNKYGNMPKGAVQRLLAKPDVFVASKGSKATRHLAPGIYKRPRRSAYRTKSVFAKGKVGNKNVGKLKGPQLLVSFEDKARYQKRLVLDKRSASTARDVFPAHFSRRFKAALATAR
ncbi:hypothetical protein [Shimia aestuarii]|uniref:hypothetical protein n=1 Tax=Shimia aestuarii TaxID=254406 RepID=UPI001FB476EC|nr:hypothetical protein [Shimia aestuarii]